MAISKREANKKQCKHNILKASRRSFKEKGYEATVIEDIVEKAEISKATFYNYFPNKESLLTGTMDEEIENFRMFIEQMDDNIPSIDKLRQAMEFLIIDSIPFMSVSRRIIFLNTCENSPLFRKVDEIKKILAELTEKVKEEGDFIESVKAEDVAEILTGLYITSQFQWSDIEVITQRECRERIAKNLDLSFAAFRSEK